jgi:hypothetical protein
MKNVRIYISIGLWCFSYIVSVRFVGGENHRPVAGDCDKRYHMMLHRVMKYTMKVAMYKISQ